MRRSLRDIEGILHRDTSLMRNVGKHLIYEEMDDDIGELKNMHNKYYSLLNSSQLLTYEAIISFVENDEGILIFIYRHGGAGKTFICMEYHYFKDHITIKIVFPSLLQVEHLYCYKIAGLLIHAFIFL